MAAAAGHVAGSAKRATAPVTLMNLGGVHYDYQHEIERREKSQQDPIPEDDKGGSGAALSD